MPHTQQIDHLLSQATAAQDVPGVAAMAANRDDILYAGAFGTRTLGTDASMTLDTVCWIASMTKAVTTVAAMQLIEQGRLTLDAPVSQWAPDLTAPQVLTGFAADGQPQLRTAARPITLRHLLTHTAGFGYDMWNAPLAQYAETTSLPRVSSCQLAALRAPLLFEPGERWNYGINIDWAGQVVEAVSGMRLDQYVHEHICTPLGMRDTSFHLSAAQQARLASVHQRGADGSLQPVPFAMPQDPEFIMGGGGLYSTVQDYLIFTRMLLHDGSFQGTRILRPETIALMAQNHLGDLNVTAMQTVAPALSRDADFFPGMPQKWGLSFLINTALAPTGRAAGSLAWAGLANTYFWIDRTTGVCGVFLTQILPFFDEKAIPLFRAYETAVYQALAA
jgi:CubicO group peptidase (beta-lactamase class C family)